MKINLKLKIRNFLLYELEIKDFDSLMFTLFYYYI